MVEREPWPGRCGLKAERNWISIEDLTGVGIDAVDLGLRGSEGEQAGLAFRALGEQREGGASRSENEAMESVH